MQFVEACMCAPGERTFLSAIILRERAPGGHLLPRNLAKEVSKPQEDTISRKSVFDGAGRRHQLLFIDLREWGV